MIAALMHRACQSLKVAFFNRNLSGTAGIIKYVTRLKVFLWDEFLFLKNIFTGGKKLWK